MAAFKGYAIRVFPPAGNTAILRVTSTTSMGASFGLAPITIQIPPVQHATFVHPAGTNGTFYVLVEQDMGGGDWITILDTRVNVSAGQIMNVYIPASSFGGVDEDQAAFDAAANQADKPTITRYAVLGLGLIAAIWILPKMFQVR